MGLRNAFDEVATEGTLRALLRVFQEGRFLPYAKDTNDRMRVAVDTGTVTSIAYLGNASAVPGASNVVPWSSGTGVLMDDRAEQQDFTLLNFMTSRSRWTIS